MPLSDFDFIYYSPSQIIEAIYGLLSSLGLDSYAVRSVHMRRACFVLNEM